MYYGGLNEEQVRNLKAEGYRFEIHGSSVYVDHDSPTGLVRYRVDNGKVDRIDSYFGDPLKKGGSHDRVGVDRNGKMFGHSERDNRT